MIIPISNVVVDDRIRGISQATVDVLKASINEVGLLNPITVGRTIVVRSGSAQDGYTLIGGLHRLEAAKSLGWDKIEATVTDLSGPHAVIAECDENLCGPNLTAVERALFTRRRKEAYLVLHPETRHGENQHTRSCQLGNSETETKRFTADTAAKTGQSERVIQRDAARGDKVSPDVLAKVAGTKLDTGKTLDELASIPKDAQPARLMEIAERKAVKPAPLPLNDIETKEQWKTAFMRVWNRGARDWRDEVLDEIQSPVFDSTRVA
jgi:ParB family chromosome partitioning protein